MDALALHEFHHSLNARFTEVNGREVVADYGDARAEHAALMNSAGVIDLSFRGRVCLVGADRTRFLNGQVTGDIKNLPAGNGIYTALVTARGKLESDLFVYNLPDELLLDFEPGYQSRVCERLDKYIIADDVQVADVTPHYGLLSVQGPMAGEVVRQVGLKVDPPSRALTFVKSSDDTPGEIYLMNQPRIGSAGFDLFVPVSASGAVADKLFAAAKSVGGRPSGWEALEVARIEAGIPRFGGDMDETNLAPEAIPQAISYTKGCYIGQEVIARIRTYGQVAKSLRGLLLPDDLSALPARGDKLTKEGKEVGYITSAIRSQAFEKNIALGYVRRECNEPNTTLNLAVGSGEASVEVVDLPFKLSRQAAP